MGLYDRDYTQDYHQPRDLPPAGARTMATNLVILNVILFLANSFFVDKGRNTNWLTDQLMVYATSWQTPLQWWQFLSYGFAHANFYPHLFFNMFGLWMFGRPVEQRIGKKPFLQFYLLTLVLCSVVWTVTTHVAGYGSSAASLLGASGAVTAIILLFVLYYPKERVLLMFVIPVPAWVMGVLFIVMNMWGAMAANDNVAYDVHLVGAACGAAYFYLKLNLGRGWKPPRKWGSARGKLKIHQPGKRSSKLDGEADRILEKIHREGEESLSTKERRILEDYSRQMRQKQR